MAAFDQGHDRRSFAAFAMTGAIGKVLAPRPILTTCNAEGFEDECYVVGVAGFGWLRAMPWRWTVGTVALIAARWNLAHAADETAGGVGVWLKFTKHQIELN